MLRTLSLSYVVCQVGGWGLLMGFCWWQYPHLVDKMSVIVIDGLLVSHCLREVFVRFRWMELRPGKGLLRVWIAVIIASMAGGVIRWVITAMLFDQPYSFLRLVAAVLDLGMLMVCWAGIYCLFQYRNVARRMDLQERVLEQRLDEMRRREAESMDAGAVVDRLRQIEGMIDEDAAGARQAITEFSKLLRKGVLKVD